VRHQQRESDKQWQDAETKDEREARLHWEREIGRSELLWTLSHLLMSSHYLRSYEHCTWTGTFSGSYSHNRVSLKPSPWWSSSVWQYSL